MAPSSPSITPPSSQERAGLALWARSLVFNVAFWLWTSVLVIAALPLLLLPPRVMVAFAQFWERGIQWLLRNLIGLDYEVRGWERIPAGPVIFAFKHQSAWETLTCHLLIGDAAVALKQELTQIPLFGWYLLHSGMIRIDRGGGAAALRSLVRGARAALARGSRVVIFPEGTRVAPGEQKPYHAGIAALYLRLDLPVVPVALNSGLFWRRRGFVKRPGRIVVEFLEPIAPGLERKPFVAELKRRLEGATTRLIEEASADQAAA